MPLAPSRVWGVFRYAMYFDGRVSRVIVPHSDVLNIASGNRITIEIVAYLTGWQSGYPVGVLIDKRTEKQANYNWEYNGSVMMYRIHAAGALWIVSVPHFLNTWNHYAMVLNGSVLRGYLNGELRAERTDVPVAGVNTVDLHIGETYLGAYRARGYIALVRVYSCALTDDEIRWNYNYPWNPVRSGLVLWLMAYPGYVKDVDGDGVLEWIDLSGYGNHGKIYDAQLVEFTKPKQPVRVLAKAR
jgi:hypothetical protein